MHTYDIFFLQTLASLDFGMVLQIYVANAQVIFISVVDRRQMA